MRPPERVASVFLGKESRVARTGVYVDAFNIYYSLLKDHNCHKWLSWQKLAAHLLPDDDIVFVKYFTSRVIPKADGDRAPIRQGLYIRALKAEGTEVFEGKFRKYDAWHTSAFDPSQKHRIVKYEEKMTDTLIVAETLVDAFEDRADTFVIATNDSDFKPALDKLQYFGKMVGVLYPNAAGARVNGDLKISSHFQKPIKLAHLESCLLPMTVLDHKGREIHCPNDWR
ncbi:MAG: NYN domain-containing protein [Pseudobdellovibrionaceae bacterium]|nr:NYN domain-containing protein [Pseudobdellovibrionaceae bacterium]